MRATEKLYQDSVNSSTRPTYTLPAVLPADSAGREGFLRIVNRSFQSGDVRIHAFDDTGERFGPITLALDAEEAVHLTSRDLERGSAAKGLPVGLGNGSGWWRLALETDLALTPLAYVRTPQPPLLPRAQRHHVSADRGDRHRGAVRDTSHRT